MTAALALLLMGAEPAQPESDAQRLVTSAALLFRDLEYEKAVEQLQRARQLAKTADEVFAVALHEGVVYAELGRKEDASRSFFEALTLRPDASLPFEVGPRVKAAFAAEKLRVPSAAIEPPPSPVRPSLPVQLEPPGDAETPVAEVVAKRPWSKIGSIAVLGLGVVAAGMATFSVATMRQELDRAYVARTIPDIDNHLMLASRWANASYVLWGVAGAAGVAALLWWLATW